MKKFLLLFVATLSFNASAEYWIDLSEGHNSLYYDKDSIESRYDHKGNLITSMWMLQPSDIPVMHPNGAGIMTLLTANCSNMSIKISEMVEVDVRKRPLWRLSRDPDRSEMAKMIPLQYYHPIPGDNYANNLKALCHPSTIKFGFENAKL